MKCVGSRLAVSTSEVVAVTLAFTAPDAWQGGRDRGRRSITLTAICNSHVKVGMAPPEVDLRAFVPMESQREERTPARPVGGGGDEFSRDASSREEEASRQQELLGEQLRLQEANLQEMRDQEMRMQELSRQLQAEREELELLRRQPLQPEEPDVQPDEETAPAKPSFLRRCVNLLACGAGKKRSESEEAHAEGDPQEHNSDEDSEGPDVHDLRPVGNADWVNSRTPRIT